MDLSNYQVVRQEFGMSQEVIQVTFNQGRLYVNNYTLSQFPEEDYIQVLVDEDTKSMVIKPSVKKKRDSFKWSGGLNKRKARRIGCKPLYYLVYRLMEWDINCRYRIDGEIEDYGEQKVIFVDLRDAICFKREDDGNKRMQMPEEWLKSFGMPYMDYKNRQDIKTFEDMAVFDVQMDMVSGAKKKMEELKETTMAEIPGDGSEESSLDPRLE